MTETVTKKGPPETYEEAQSLLKRLIVAECYRRAKLYDAMRPGPKDSKAQRESKAIFLIATLRHWKKDPVAWLSDMAWAPDPKGTFGSRAIPDELRPWVPKGMVPFIPFKIQKDLALAWDEIMRGDVDRDLAAVKSRQVFFTGELCWLGLREFLFHDSSPGLLGSYGEQFIDEGGKGQREPLSLFGRMRMFLDAMVYCLPALKFNQHRKRARAVLAKWVDSPSGFEDTEDISFKMVRPRWTVFGQRMFPGAEGNWMRGALPSDNFGRSYTARWALLDELAAYNKALGEGKDRDAWNACNQNVFMRAGWGTIPKGGGPGSMLHTLMEESDGDPTLIQVWCHWSDILPYMAGAEWTCRSCTHRTAYRHPSTNAIQPGPRRHGVRLVCGRCAAEQRVRYKDMWSPWFERACQRMKWDKEAIARELQMDWLAAQGDVLFPNMPENLDGAVDVRDGVGLIYAGIDPGVTMSNPGAWIMGRLNPSTLMVEVLGCWTAANPHSAYWVPFLKHWNAKTTRRMRVTYGHMKGSTFGDAFEYPEEAYEMLDACSQFPAGHIQGDKYGSHNQGEGTFYQGLQRYGIYVASEYTKDREDLVRDGIESTSRIRLWDKTCDIRPPTPLGGYFPSMKQAFTTAVPAVFEGESRRRLDVSKKTPKYVSNPVDAWFYMVKGMGVEVHHVADQGGDWGVEDGAVGRYEDFGDKVFGF